MPAAVRSIARAAPRQTRVPANDRGCGLDAQEHQRRKRRDAADRSKKHECRQQHGRPARELVRRAPCVRGQVDILSGEHAVVGIPQIALAPQQQPEREQHRRVHPRQPLARAARRRSQSRAG